MKFRENYLKLCFSAVKQLHKKKKIVGIHEFWFFVAKGRSILGILLMFAVFTASMCIVVTIFFFLCVCSSIWLNEITD
jgi:hypothetical protein